MCRRILLLPLFFFLLTGPALSRPLVDKDGKVIKADKAFTRIISLYAAHTRNLSELRNIPLPDLVNQRYEKVRRIGVFDQL